MKSSARFLKNLPDRLEPTEVCKTYVVYGQTSRANIMKINILLTTVLNFAF